MSVDLLELTPPPAQRKQAAPEPTTQVFPMPIDNTQLPAQTSALAEYIIEGAQPSERYFLHDSTMPIKLHTDGTVELGLMLDDKLNQVNKERFEQERHTLPRVARAVQLYHPSVAEQVAASGMAVVKNEVSLKLKTAYNDKLAEYNEVSAKLNRHKFMNPAVLAVHTERFIQLITDLSDILDEVDAIREHTLGEAVEGFAV